MSIHDNVNNLRDAERALLEAGFTGMEAWVFINTCLGAGLRIRNGGGQPLCHMLAGGSRG